MQESHAVILGQIVPQTVAASNNNIWLSLGSLVIAAITQIILHKKATGTTKTPRKKRTPKVD